MRHKFVRQQGIKDWPFIAHIKLDEKYDHFIIIKNIKKDKIIVEDPIRGKVIYDKNMFLKEWTNVVITFEKTNDLVKENTEKNICVFKNRFIITFFLFLLSRSLRPYFLY